MTKKASKGKGKKSKGGSGDNFGARLAGALKSMGVSKHAIATHDVAKSEYKQAAAIVNHSESLSQFLADSAAQLRETLEILEHIRKEGDKFVLYSKDGKKRLGEYPSREAALNREQQVEYFKNKAGG